MHPNFKLTSHIDSPILELDIEITREHRSSLHRIYQQLQHTCHSRHVRNSSVLIPLQRLCPDRMERAERSAIWECFLEMESISVGLISYFLDRVLVGCEVLTFRSPYNVVLELLKIDQLSYIFKRFNAVIINNLSITSTPPGFLQ